MALSLRSNPDVDSKSLTQLSAEYSVTLATQHLPVDNNCLLWL